MPKVKKIQMPNGAQLDLGADGFDWIGTKAEYDALEEYNDDWFYCITDDTNISSWIPELTEAKEEAIEEVRKSAKLKGWNLFDTKWSDHVINDMPWLRADTFSWQSGDVYKTVYDKLVEEYSTGTEETEGSITFRRSSNNFKIATSDMESAILNKYNSDGISWYYILDTTNKRFKLPRTKFGFEGLRNKVGNDITETLPNITGNLYAGGGVSFEADGAMAITANHSNAYSTNWYGNAGGTSNFNASRSSSTYQDNAPVQERATQMYLYFYVGEYAQTAIEQTAGITSEQLNAKVDTSSLSEINPMIESYVNGTSGYNIWANGYCEQWGYLSANSSAYIQGVSISILKKFIDTNFQVITTLQKGSQTNDNNTPYNGWVINKTNTGFKITIDTTSYMDGVQWRAYGYLAEGEY